ncbi:hypothetical protein AM571_CH02156 [Rhizobium etli 8C-3]|uniref:Uncharacterized protein n=2 Tax=Rhizobium TaxID=379 RepID=A0A1L5P498_RHIET|nr:MULTISPECIES: hypothetical protein [Rhizobium]APO74965.1 hypothetical protein AM571_CH02156 [Rhizobium etli 8C-3]TCU31668.1 hypothetical protein EV129_12533 [Rhizobium azibense]
MADLTWESRFEILRKTQSDRKKGQRDNCRDINSLSNHMRAMQGDTKNLRGTMSQVLDRLGRIENRHELRQLAEAQARFEPHP